MPIEFMGEIHMDNTDLLTIILEVFDAITVLTTAQENLETWACLLIMTGNGLNPAKC
jgi:hypothetical protein